MAIPGEIKLPVGEHQNVPTPPVLTELVIGTDKYNINDKGEAVDNIGKVIKTKDELETLKRVPELTQEQKDAAKVLLEKTNAIKAQLIEGAEIELDGVVHKLTKDGTIVVDGKVIKTKTELENLLLNSEPTSTDVDYVSEIQKITNLTIAGDKGEPITYENTVQGLAQREQDVFKEGRKIGATEFEQQLLTQFPIIKDVIEHLTLKGSLKDFNEEVDYSKIVLSEDENQHIDIFTKAKLAQGLPASEIADLVNYYKTDKKLKSAAEISLTYLKTDQENRSSARATQIANAKAAQEVESTAYWNEVNKAINSKELVVGDKKFKIPEIIKIKDTEGKTISKTIKDFHEYIEKPLNFKIDGKVYTMTQLEYDEYLEDTKRTPHNDVYDAFRRFTKYDDSQIIAANISSNVVKQIIKLKTKASGGSGDTSRTGKLLLPIK